MSARITRADVEYRIATVQNIARSENVSVINYSGKATFDSLALQGAYGTYTLEAHNGGYTVSTARGLRDIDTYLQGMADALQAIRYTRIAQTEV